MRNKVLTFRTNTLLRVVSEVHRLSLFAGSTIQTWIGGAVLLLCHDGSKLGGIGVVILSYNRNEFGCNGIIGPFRTAVFVDDILGLVHNNLKVGGIHGVSAIARALSIAFGVRVLVHDGRPNAGPSLTTNDTEAIFILHCRGNLRHFRWAGAWINQLLVGNQSHWMALEPRVWVFDVLASRIVNLLVPIRAT